MLDKVRVRSQDDDFARSVVFDVIFNEFWPNLWQYLQNEGLLQQNTWFWPQTESYPHIFFKVKAYFTALWRWSASVTLSTAKKYLEKEASIIITHLSRKTIYG